jgi:antirestriction protein ArdC
MSDETQIKTAPATEIPPPAPSPFAPEPPGPVPAPAPRKRGSFPTRPSSSAGAGTEENRRNVYQIVTSRILELLERGTVPWRAGWTASGAGEPRSAITGKAYRGINSFLLAVAAQAGGYRNDSWMTFRQAKELGGSIRKGEKGSLCIFWRILDGASTGSADDGATTDATAEDETAPRNARRRFVLRYYTVFNVEQCDGLPARFSAASAAAPTRQILPCERIISGFPRGPRIEHGFNSASYSVADDRIAMPAFAAFRAPEEYYATLFHEATHSTGHPDRLGRFSATDAPAPFGSPDYSREELVAEMGSALLCARAGISCATIENQAAYIAGWLKTLQADSKAVVIAAAQAQRAVDHILGTGTDAEQCEQLS